MFFLRISERFYKRELFLEIKLKPILKPEAALACGESEGKVRWSNGVARWYIWFLQS